MDSEDSPFTNLAQSRSSKTTSGTPPQAGPLGSGIKPRRPPPPLPPSTDNGISGVVPNTAGNPFATPPQHQPSKSEATATEEVVTGLEFLGLASTPAKRAPPPPPPPPAVSPTQTHQGQSTKLSSRLTTTQQPPQLDHDKFLLIDVDASPFQPSSSAVVGSIATADGGVGPLTDIIEDEDDDIFGLKQLAARSTATTTVDRNDNSTSEDRKQEPRRMFSRLRNISSDRRPSSGATTSTEPPVAVEVRLAPLNPKVSARLRTLAAGNGSLFAAPSANGGLLQWSRAEAELGLPIEVRQAKFAAARRLSRNESGLIHTSPSPEDNNNNNSVSGPGAVEDQDAAPSHEAGALPRKTATRVVVDDARAVLWMAYSDGHIAGYDISGDPGSALTPTKRLYYWQAHRIGHVTAMCLGPTGELWTGSSRGTLRVWQPGSTSTAASGGDELTNSSALAGGEGIHQHQQSAPARCRELRRSGGDRAHNGGILHMSRTADGQFVWTASAKSVNLWEASSGMWLGALRALNTPNMNVTPPSTIPTGTNTTTTSSPGTNYYYQPSPGIAPTSSDASGPHNSSSGGRGLAIDPATGVLLNAATPALRSKLWQQQEAWASQSDKGMAEFAERLSVGSQQVVQGAGKAVKFMTKLGQRLTQNISKAGGGNNNTNSSAASLTTPVSGSGGGTSNSLGGGLPVAGLPSEYNGSGDIEESVSTPGFANAGSIQSIVATLDNKIWVVYKRGKIEQYSAAGQLLGAKDLGFKIQVAAAVGRRVWVAFTNGWVSILGPDGGGLKSFKAHQLGIIALAQAASRVYTLAADGSLTGWSAATPSSADTLALESWHEKAPETFVRRTLKMLCVTWNCGESKPYPGSEVFRHVREQALEKSLIVVGLQEVEMGSTSVALAAAKDAISYKIAERGNANAKFWSSGILSALGGDRHWHQVGLRQLSGMLILVFARNTLKGHIGEVATASVACGVLGVGGNKGAVAVEFTLYRRKFTVVCSHFAAHQGAVEARNGNYATISKQLTFTKRAWFATEEDEVVQHVLPGSAGVVYEGDTGSTSAARKGSSEFGDFDDFDLDPVSGGAVDTLITATEEGSIASATETSSTTATTTTLTAETDLIQGEGLRAADLLVWMGDFNYRIDMAYDEVKQLIAQGKLAPLLEKDQCRGEMLGNRVFRGLCEGSLSFPPTYKFDKGVPNPLAYDSSEKRRVPAWCDRIMFRGSKPFPPLEESMGGIHDDTDSVKEEEERDENNVTVCCKEYSSWADVYDSDHKPVYAILEISLPVTDYDQKRDTCSHILAKYCPARSTTLAPELALSSTSLTLHSKHTPHGHLTLSNIGGIPAFFHILPISVTIEAAACVGLRPDRGLLLPGEEMTVYVTAMVDEESSFVPGPREVRYQVLGGPEYTSVGGEEGGSTRVELEFQVVVRPQYHAK